MSRVLVVALLATPAVAVAPRATAGAAETPVRVAGEMSNQSQSNYFYGGYDSTTTDTPLANLQMSVYATNVEAAGDGSVWIRDLYDIIRIDQGSGTYRRVAGVSPNAVANGYPDLTVGLGTGVGRPATEVVPGWGGTDQMTVDSSGNLLYVDGNAIYRVGADNIVVHVAGTGTQGNTGDGGPATAADIDPHALVVDATGTIWFLSGYVQALDGTGREYSGYSVLRRIGANGIIQTVAGSGDSLPTGDGGPASAASFGASGLARAGDGDLVLLGSSAVETIGARAEVRVIDAATGTIASIVPSDRVCDHNVWSPDGVRVIGGELRYVGAQNTENANPGDPSLCRIDLATGVSSSEPLGLSTFDRRSNLDLDANGTVWFTMYSDNPGESGLFRVGAGLSADVSATVTGPTSTTIGAEPEYTVTAANIGVGAAADAALVVSVTGGRLNGASGTLGPCTFGGTPATLTCPYGTLAAGQSFSGWVSAIADSPGSMSVNATITTTSTDSVPTNNTASATTTVTNAAPTNAIVWERTTFDGLYVGEPGGPTPREIVPGPAGYPSWSPDHVEVVYTAGHAGQFDLWIANADGSSQHQITNDAAQELTPTWSPDGNRIAFSRYEAGLYDIWTIRADGSDAHRVTSGFAFDDKPTWSPNSQRLAYRSGSDLWISNADGTSATALTSGPGYEIDPDWSPDGAQILFSSQSIPGGNIELQVINIDGTNRHSIFSQLGYAPNAPSWSPDGTHLAFSSIHSGDPEIWTMKANGTELAQLSTLGGLRPDWGMAQVPPPPPPHLGVTATTATTGVVSGSSFTVTGKASNTGTGGAASASIDFTVDHASIATLTMAGATCQVVSATNRRCTLGTLAVGQQRTYALGLIAGTPGSATAIVNLTCSCTDPGATATASRTILGTPPKPTLRVGVNGPTTADQGDPIAYTYVVTNDLAVNATAAKLTVLPTTKPKAWPVPVASLTSTSGSCTTAPLVCNLGSLAPGASATITLVTTGGVHGGSLTMTGKVSCTCTDPVAADNTAALTTVVRPRIDVGIGITNPTNVTGNDPVSFTGTITGIGDNVVDVDGDFVLPDGFVPTTLRPTPGGVCSVAGNVVHCRWTGVTGLPGVVITGDIGLGGSYHLTGDIGSCSCIDSGTGNNHFVGPDCEHPQVADLVIRKVSPPRAEIGDIITWTIEVENRGPQGAPGVIVRDPLPTAVQYVGTTPDQGTCSYATAGRLVTCNLGTVANGEIVRVLVRARALKAGSIVNGANVACTCHNVSGIGGGGTGTTALPIPTWPVVPTPLVRWCDDFRIPGVCTLEVRLPNPNPGPIPPSTLEIPRGPGNGGGGLRLGPGPYPPGVTCVELPLVIRCTFPPTPPGGRGYELPFYPDDRGTYDDDFTWNCGCTDQGPSIIDVGTHTPICECIGGQILFDSDVTGDRDVYSTTLAGHITNLTHNPTTEDAGAVWSPDRKRFAFHRGVPGKRKLWIATLDNVGCIKSQLYIANQPSSDNYQPDWSPDGGTLAFISKQSGNHDIWTIGIDGSSLTRITSATVDDRAPSFSDDGDRIAFASRRTPTTSGGDWNIWTAKADGTGGERFLSTAEAGYVPGGADYSPSFTRDAFSSVILWHTNSGGNWDLWMMNPDGSNKHRVPNATALAEKNGDWAISDTKIVYDAGTGSAGIWVMNGDGTNRHQIAATGGKDQAPSW